jgi:hypothetical protein
MHFSKAMVDLYAAVVFGIKATEIPAEFTVSHGRALTLGQQSTSNGG